MRTAAGLGLEDVTLEALQSGRLLPEDVRATPATLRYQAEVARAAGREPLAEALERAAELSGVPDELVLEIYTALRPGRANAAELEAYARRLEEEFEAPRVAAFVREARDAYAAREILA